MFDLLVVTGNMPPGSFHYFFVYKNKASADRPQINIVSKIAINCLGRSNMGLDAGEATNNILFSA